MARSVQEVDNIEQRSHNGRCAVKCGATSLPEVSTKSKPQAVVPGRAMGRSPGRTGTDEGTAPIYPGDASRSSNAGPWPEVGGTSKASPMKTHGILLDETGRIKSIVEITERDGNFYGQVVELFRLPDEDQDPYCDKCEDDRKDKRVLGMEIVRDMEFDEE